MKTLGDLLLDAKFYTLFIDTSRRAVVRIVDEEGYALIDEIVIDPDTLDLEVVKDGK